MIGTGIFTTPVAILVKTHNNKGLALGLWILGFVYTLIRYRHIEKPMNQSIYSS
jgi:hypothetical protein